MVVGLLLLYVKISNFSGWPCLTINWSTMRILLITSFTLCWTFNKMKYHQLLLSGCNQNYGTWWLIFDCLFCLCFSQQHLILRPNIIKWILHQNLILNSIVGLYLLSLLKDCFDANPRTMAQNITIDKPRRFTSVPSNGFSYKQRC